jgi:phosphatidylglycerophosphate synthase
MDSRSLLLRSIVRYVGSLLGFQVVFLSIVAAIAGIPLQRFWSFFPVTAAFHAAVAAGLILRSEDFHTEPEGRMLHRLNLANALTLIRLSALPTICYLLALCANYPLLTVLIVYTALAFLTDLVDGVVSRRGNQVTRVGKYLDSTSDYSVLIVISIAFAIYDLIPTWLFVLVLVRLLAQGMAMGFLLFVRGSLTPTSSWWGKVSVFATMTLYATELLLLLPVPPLLITVVSGLEYVTAGILVISLGEKLVNLVLELRKQPQ